MHVSSLATVVAVGSRPRCGGAFDDSGSEHDRTLLGTGVLVGAQLGDPA